MSYADYDFDSDDDYYELEGDYIWAEDGGWELADELASGAIPDPPALYYREEEWEEHDKYDFWSELEYGNGDIYDGEVATEEGTTPIKAGDKRKRSNAAGINETIKRTRLAGIQDYPTVLWKSTRESFSLRQECPLYKKPQKPYALLPDWRERFKDAPRFAATSKPEIPAVSDDKSQDDEEEEGEMGDWEDMEEDDDDDGGSQEEMDEGVHLQDIDPDLLRSAMIAKLSSSGLAGADQAAFMETLMQMMSGEGGEDADSMLENLTSTLLNSASQGGANSSTARWLSGQGVSLEEGDEEDEAEEENHKVTPATTSTDLSPQDSVAAEKLSIAKGSAATKPSTSADTETAGKKRKQVSFESTTSQPEAAALVPGPNSKRVKKAATETTQTPVTVRVPTESKATKPQTKASKTDASDASKTTKPAEPTRLQTKATKAVTPKYSEITEPTKTTRAKAKTAGIGEEAPKTEPLAQTRKRKATTEVTLEEKPKRQQRNFAAPTASSQSKTAETKTTRSGKARK